MTAVVCFVGMSNSGKTTVLERLVPEMKARGHRVAVIKHCHHGVDVDRSGSDSERAWQSGADIVVASGPGQTVTWKRTRDEETLEALVGSIGDQVDYVLVEGHKQSGFPKIVIGRNGLPDGLQEVIGVVAEGPTGPMVPHFGPSDIGALASFLEERFLVLGSGPGRDAITLTVNGRNIPLSQFPRAVISSGVLGMIVALNGIPEMYLKRD